MKVKSDFADRSQFWGEGPRERAGNSDTIGRLRGGEAMLQFAEGAVIGALERGLVAGEFGDGVAAFAVAKVGVGDGIVRDDGRGGLGLEVEGGLGVGQGVGLVGKKHATEGVGDVVGEILIVKGGVVMGGDEADLKRAEAFETPGGERHLDDEERLNFIGGPAKGEVGFAESEELGLAFVREERCGEGAMFETVARGASLALGGAGPGAAGGIGAVGGNLSGGCHGLDRREEGPGPVGTDRGGRRWRHAGLEVVFLEGLADRELSFEDWTMPADVERIGL